MNSLPKTVTQQRRDCDLNPSPSAPESSTLTTRLPSHRCPSLRYCKGLMLAERGVHCPVPTLRRGCLYVYKVLTRVAAIRQSAAAAADPTQWAVTTSRTECSKNCELFRSDSDDAM